MRMPDIYVGKNLGKELICAEIGVLHGDHALAMLKGLPIKKLYLIDPYITYPIYCVEPYPQGTLDEDYIKVKSLEQEYAGVVEVLRMPSLEAAELLKEIPFDYVYIDGNHEHPHVDNDVKVWWDLVKKGGVLSGHDILLNDVYTAVNDFVQMLKLSTDIFIFSVDSENWLIHK